VCACLVSEKRWSSLKELSDSCGRSLAEMVDDLKGFDAANTQITSWLGQKEKMISVLGPLAAEPVMIRSQIQQLEVNDASLLIRMLSSAVSRLTNGVFSIR